MGKDDQVKKNDESAKETEADGPENAGARAPLTEDFEAKYLRALADMDNMRKRTEREMEVLRKYSTESLIMDIIRSVEDMERAMNDASDDPRALRKGISMILNDLKNTLDKHGVARIPVDGPFDPAMHEAMLQDCTDRADDDGKIAEVIQPGYLLHDRVIRHAKVKVYKYTENKKEMVECNDEESALDGSDTGGDEK